MDTGNNKKGFTLVEILVVLAIFSIMLTAITSLFISGIKVQQNSIAQEQLIDQVNYAVDYMGRAIMMAKKDKDNSCQTKDDNYSPNSGPSTYLGFVNQIDGASKCVVFWLDNGRIYKENVKSADRSVASGLPLTSDNIKITTLRFYITGDAGNSGVQPKVTILIEAESKSGSPVQKIKVQTTISSRDLNK